MVNVACRLVRWLANAENVLTLRYSLAANSAGKRLLTAYCDADCRFVLEVPEVSPPEI